MNGQQVGIGGAGNFVELNTWLCTSCSRLWKTREQADECCTCLACHEYVAQSRGAPRKLYHDDCMLRQRQEIDQQRLDKAVVDAEYSGPVMYGETWYSCVDDMIDQIEAEELPDYVFCMKFKPFYLDINSAVENVEQDHHEDFGIAIPQYLRDAVDKFNDENAENGTWWEDYKRKTPVRALVVGNEVDDAGER